MKRRIIISTFALVLASSYALAQDDSVLWGIKASIDSERPGKWHGDGDAVKIYRPGYGVTIGGVSNIYLGKSFYFEPGLSLAYSQYKDDIAFSDSYGEIRETDTKIYKWSFQIPLVVGCTIDIPDKYALNVFIGPQVRYAFAGGYSFKNKEVAEEAAEYGSLWKVQQRFDASWKVGIGLPVNNFIISLEADFGVTDLLKNDLSFRENRAIIGLTYFL